MVSPEALQNKISVSRPSYRSGRYAIHSAHMCMGRAVVGKGVKNLVRMLLEGIRGRVIV